MAALFPTLLGQDIEITRSPTWDGGANVITAVSGKETSIAYWANPRWLWEIKMNFLRSGVRYGIARTEMQDLVGFFNARRSIFDAFLYNERDDNFVAAQVIGAINGASIQLVRTLGAFTEPVLAPFALANVLDNGVAVSPANYTFTQYGNASPGVLTFLAGHVPVAGHIITADINYYWPVRFMDKTLDLNRFLAQLYKADSIKMISKK